MADASPPASSNALRLAVYAVAAAHTVFFIYALYRIFTAPAGDGSGMNIIGIVPLGVLFLAGVFPAVSYARSGKPVPSLVFALLGFGITQWLWWTMMVHELNIA